MDRLDFALEVKGVTDAGLFEGYASTFGDRDLGGDIVVAGAMTKSLKARGAKGVRMFADHDSRKRIGVWTDLIEDEKGLYVKGRLLLEKQDGKDAYIDLKEGALDGMSIGFRTKSDSYDGRRKARMLKEIDLLEISLVSFPMNENARVTGVKGIGDLSPEEIREIEAILRTKDLSRADAAKAVSGFKEWLRRDAGAPITGLRDEGAADELAAIIRRNIATLS
jgi:HK97 family phage prohead protease